MNDTNIIREFKNELIKHIEKEFEQEIQVRVKKFEEQLRETASAKIVSFVDNLKITAKREFDGVTPKMIIEVHL